MLSLGDLNVLGLEVKLVQTSKITSLFISHLTEVKLDADAYMDNKWWDKTAKLYTHYYGYG